LRLGRLHTKPHPDTPRARTMPLRAKAWHQEWGALLALVFGGWLVLASVLLLVLAFAFKASETDKQRQADATAQQSYVACKRARVVGPSVIHDYEVRDVLTPRALALYKSLIPKSCPKPTAG
jgi:hypothetical protein